MTPLCKVYDMGSSNHENQLQTEKKILTIITEVVNQNDFSDEMLGAAVQNAAKKNKSLKTTKLVDGS